MNIRVCHVACHFTFPRTEFQLQPWGTDARALLAQFPIVLFSLIEKLFGKIVFRNISKLNISFLKFMKSLYIYEKFIK